uniref:Homeobox domain-containing protein n=1 Tax=Acrobeloides nanus TaxID=290746 RepID=A0A914DJK0_9BILA
MEETTATKEDQFFEESLADSCSRNGSVSPSMLEDFDSKSALLLISDATKKSLQSATPWKAFSPWQRQILETTYQKNPYIRAEERKDLSEKTGLTDAQVLHWFVHRRYKAKKASQKYEKVGSTPSPVPASKPGWPNQFEPWQTQALMEKFKETKNIDGEERRALSKRTGLTEKQISKWFMHRRAKERKKLGISYAQISNYSQISQVSQSSPFDEMPLSFADGESLLFNHDSTVDSPSCSMNDSNLEESYNNSIKNEEPDEDDIALSVQEKLLQANFYYMEKDGNLMLSVGEKMFFVNKERLSERSQYFNALFLIYSKANIEAPVEVTNIEPDELKELLRAIKSSGGTITGQNVGMFLSLGERFDFADITKYCENFLRDKSRCNFSIMKKIQLADEHKLNDLMKFCVEEMNNLPAFQRLSFNAEHDQLTDFGKARLYEKLIKLVQKGTV